MNIQKCLSQLKVIPVLTIENEEDAVPLCEVLYSNGMVSAEVTFRTDAAVRAMRRIKDALPEIILGAGTVLSIEQVDLAIDAGVDFIVTPGFSPRIVSYCQEKGIPIIPGVNNPSLVEQAMEFGLKTLKFFPAEPSGGTAMLKSLSAVYPVSFMPTGGINPKNINMYLSIQNVVACGGTWMVDKTLIESKQWQDIGLLAKEAIDLVS